MKKLFAFGILVPFLAFGQVSSQEVQESTNKTDILAVIDGSGIFQGVQEPVNRIDFHDIFDNPIVIKEARERQLFLAIQMGNLSRVSSLIQLGGVDVNFRYARGETFRDWTPLMFAAYHIRPLMVKFLVNELGADPLPGNWRRRYQDSFGYC